MLAPAHAHTADFGVSTRPRFLALPWSADAPAVEVRYDGLAHEPIVRRFRLAGEGVDSWRWIPLSGGGPDPVVVTSTSPVIERARVASTLPPLTSTVHGVVLPFGATFVVLRSSRRGVRTWLQLACDLLGEGERQDIVRLSSRDGLTWELDRVVFDAAQVGGASVPVAAAPTSDGTLVCLPADEGTAPESLRVWERRLTADADGRFEIPLRFRVLPGTWPDIRLATSDGGPGEVSASAYELRLDADPGDRGTVDIQVSGFRASLSGRTLTAGERSRVVPGAGPIRLALRLEGEWAALEAGGLPPALLRAESPDAVVEATAITSNIAGFTLAARRASTGRIEVGPGVDVTRAVVYGLREPRSAVYRTTAEAHTPGAPFFVSDRFSVYDGTVADAAEPEAAALVPDRTTVVSPIRVVEEFAWRETPYGDMTRVVDRREVWRSAVEPSRFPELTTSFRSVDASFALALETFQRNASDEFALPGQSGMWSAGYFQGPGLGFGAWRRDTAHIALRGGNLLDPAVARASLAHVVDAGFDNGSDGDALPAVAIWDHLLATGAESLAYDTWAPLTTAVAALDARFDDARGLVVAPQSTSNDLFDEPEAGGFALGTEVYAMQTYAAMARMAGLPGIRDARGDRWAARAESMRRAILAQYWNAERGYFTSGPVGSESYREGYWETSGAEAALWGYLGAEAETLTGSVLRAMDEVAMSDYGVVLFPYRQDDNHFCGSVWYCWQAGIARAAARAGDAALVHRLIAQQVRTVILNKTFYEVTDAATGASWRWPGQLWHAAGFASLVLFGVFGIHYDVAGMTFTPAVAPQFEGARLDRLRFREAVLDLEIRGHGNRCRLTLDGQRVELIPGDLTGRHTVVLTMR